MQDEAELHYLASRFGPIACYKLGAGPALVLFHGGTGSANHWRANIGALARSRTVLAFDLPGFGLSAAPVQIASADYLDELARLTETATAGAGFSLAGFSFGAVCATEVAVRLGRVQKLILVAPGGFGALPLNLLVGRRIPLARPLSDAARAAAAYNLGRFMLLNEPSPNDEVVDLHLQNLLRTRFDSHPISLGDGLADLLPKVSASLLVIWGASDALVGPGGIAARSAAIEGACPAAETAILPQAGHWVMRDAAQPFNTLVQAFLANDGPGASA